MKTFFRLLPILILSMTVLSLSCNNSASKSTAPTAGEVVERIKENLNCSWSKETVDTFKSGSEDMKVTGIVATFLASQEVLEKAVKLGCNMIITHEPTYYNHLDRTDEIGDDEVLKAKKKYIEDNGLIVFRFHDHWHRTSPDGIYVGMINQLRWNDHQIQKDQYVFKLAEQSLESLCKDLQETYPTATLRIIGNPEMEVTKVGLALGAPSYQSHVRMLQRDDVEVLIAGEAREWETVEYVRDAVTQDRKKAIIFLGHAISEEGGMEYLAEWLKPIVEEVPIHFVEAGNPLWSL